MLLGGFRWMSVWVKCFLVDAVLDHFGGGGGSRG